MSSSPGERGAAKILVRILEGINRRFQLFKFLPQTCSFGVRWGASLPFPSVLFGTLFACRELAGFFHHRICVFPPQAAQVFRVEGGGGGGGEVGIVYCQLNLGLDILLGSNLRSYHSLVVINEGKEFLGTLG